MFTIIRKFTLARGSAEKVAKRVKDSFVPLLRELPGFRGYYLLDGGGWRAGRAHQYQGV